MSAGGQVAGDAYFDRDGERFMPRELARGYWRHDMLHARPMVGLLGQELERRHGDPELMPARLGVDLFRTPPFGPVTVATRLVHGGGRLRLTEADLIIDGQVCARAQCQFLRVTEPPAGAVWSPPPWDVPPPEALATRTDGEHRQMAELRPIRGDFRGADCARQIWTRECFDIVADQPLTPFARVALAADFSSAWSNMGERGPEYMNTDVVVHLHRLPRGDWLGFEVTGNEASQGIAVGHCRLHDRAGAIGFVATTALSNERRR
ncbi:MAG TPA: acyl-CoA thioesterase domain-containing protein [Novosphingobium sp.]